MINNNVARIRDEKECLLVYSLLKWSIKYITKLNMLVKQNIFTFYSFSRDIFLKSI